MTKASPRSFNSTMEDGGALHIFFFSELGTNRSIIMLVEKYFGFIVDELRNH